MTLLSILKIQTKIFINNLAKINSIFKIIYFFAFIVIVFNYNQTGRFLIEYIKNHFHRNDAHFYEIANLLFFIIVLLNLFSVFFVGTGNTLSKQLKFFPISFIKIVLYEIILGVFDISNLAFVGIYFATYFVFYETFTMLSFLEFLSIFILFVLFISNLAFFTKNIIQNYFFAYRKKKIISMLGLVVFIILFYFVRSLNINVSNLTAISDILNYSPSGRFLLSQFNHSNHLSFQFETLIYFILLNAIFLSINISLAKKMIKINYSEITKSKRSKYSLSYFVNKSKLNSLQKKEILYHLRSYKMSVTFFLLLLIYPLFLYLTIFKSNFGYGKELLLLLQSIGIFFQLICITTLTGNIFRFGGQDLKAYFIMPILPIDLITSKAVFTYSLLFINPIFISISLFYSGLTLLNFLFYFALLLSTFYLFHFLAILLSIYFPKKVDMNALNGLNISFVTLLIFMPILLICILVVQYALGFTEILPKILVMLFSIVLSIIVSKLKITNCLAILLSKRKNSIIKSLS